MTVKSREMLGYLLRRLDLRTVALYIGVPKRTLQNFLDGKEMALDYHATQKLETLYYRKHLMRRWFRFFHCPKHYNKGS